MAYCYTLHTGTKQTLNCFSMWGFKKMFSLLLWQNVWGECAEEEEEEEEEPQKCCQLIQRGSQAGSASYLWKQAGSLQLLTGCPALCSEPQEEQGDLTCSGADYHRQTGSFTHGKWEAEWQGTHLGESQMLLRSQDRWGWLEASSRFSELNSCVQWDERGGEGESLWSMGPLWIGCSLQNAFLSQQKALP